MPGPKVNPNPAAMPVTVTMYQDGVELLANLVEAAKVGGAKGVSRGKLVMVALRLLERKPVGEIVKLLAESPRPSR